MSELSRPSILALDIGGANLKACRLDTGDLAREAPPHCVVRSTPFAVWKAPEGLASALHELITDLVPVDVVAATMTAELCDCFETKAQGVRSILDALKTLSRWLTAHQNVGPSMCVWQSTGRLVSLEVARGHPLQAAAANWMALAAYAGRWCRHGPGLLIDIGSTTTDFIPLWDASPVPAGRTDPQRLAIGEMVYSGVRRTPVCALVSQVPWNGTMCSVAAEWFATTADVYLTLGDLAENVDDCDTADGRPATRRFAHGRLARVVCGDRDMVSGAATVEIAQTIAAAQQQRLQDALGRVVERLGAMPKTVVVAGEGEFIAHRLVDGLWDERSLPGPDVVSLQNRLGRGASVAACAYALAMIVAERRIGIAAANHREVAL